MYKNQKTDGKEGFRMAKIKEEDIKTTVILTEGYEKRYTEACLKALAAREKKGILIPPPVNLEIMHKA